MTTEFSMATDAELLEKYRTTNDAAAFNELARRYQQMVFASAQRVTGDRHDAEDVAQACFLELARQQTTNIKSVAAYLHRSATHRARNLIRDQSRRRHYEEKAINERPAREAEAPAAAEWEKMVPEVDDAIETLPEKYRTPVILFYLRGLNDLEIAAELEISRSTVSRRLEVGVRMLRSVLTKAGISLSIGLLAVVLKSSVAQAAPVSLTANLGRMALVGRLGAPLGIPSVSNPLWKRLCPRLPVMAPLALLLIAGAVCLSLFSGWWKPGGLGGAGENAYDQISRHYRPAMGSGFPSHVASMSRDPALFWRGAQPLFFAWCQSQAPDWFDDPAHRVLSHASPVPADACLLPYSIDSANSVQIPFQIELLQIMVAARLESGALDDPDRLQADREIFGHYRDTLARTRQQKLASPPSYFSDEERNRFIDASGKFRTVVYSRAGNVSDLLEPLQDIKPSLQAIQEALANNDRMAAMFSGTDSAWLSSHVHAAARRTNLSAVTSQGLESVLVLLRSPLKTGTSDVILELRETIASSAELAGTVSQDKRSPARRAAEDAQRLAPLGMPWSWCNYDGKSMLVGFHDLPDKSHVVRAGVLTQSAAATAATHQGAVNRTVILAALSPELLASLSQRADAAAKAMTDHWTDFSQDARAVEDARVTQQLVSEQISRANQSARNTQRNIQRK